MDAGHDPFAVLNDCQDHVVLVGRVYAERLIMEAFADAVGALPRPGARALLARLCDLYALSRIEADRGWFQEHGRLSSPRSKAVIQAVNSGLRPAGRAGRPAGGRLRGPRGLAGRRTRHLPGLRSSRRRASTSTTC